MPPSAGGGDSNIEECLDLIRAAARVEVKGSPYLPEAGQIYLLNGGRLDFVTEVEAKTLFVLCHPSQEDVVRTLVERTRDEDMNEALAKLLRILK